LRFSLECKNKRGIRLRQFGKELKMKLDEKFCRNLPVTDIELGELFDLSARAIRDLCARGIIRRSGRGRYRPNEATRGYINHLRQIIWDRHGFWA
jgi:hypothetical protein